MTKPKAPWTPFKNSFLPPLTPAEREAMIDDIVSRFPLTREQAGEQMDDLRKDAVYLNSRYQVNVRAYGTVAPYNAVVHLSIKRIDKERVGVERYRDFQRIKNEIVGPDFEAVEIYPAHGDEIDTANQYHLWVFASGYKLPFGWHGQRAVDGTSPLGGKQHPLE